MNFDDTARFFGTTRLQTRTLQQESYAIFKKEQDELWDRYIPFTFRNAEGKIVKAIPSRTPEGYLDGEDAAWKRHLDRISLLRGISYCRTCNATVSKGKRFCPKCSRKRRTESQRKWRSNVDKMTPLSASA